MIGAAAATAPARRDPPPSARILGYAGLLPQAIVVAVLAAGPTGWHAAALSLGQVYAALILSFLGGLWWGLAARRPDPAPLWLWLAAVTPSLIAFATFVPQALGADRTGPSLAALGVSLAASLLVDRRLVAAGTAPAWWMMLRVPLSAGLGLLTLAAAAIG